MWLHHVYKGVLLIKDEFKELGTSMAVSIDIISYNDTPNTCFKLSNVPIAHKEILPVNTPPPCLDLWRVMRMLDTCRVR